MSVWCMQQHNWHCHFIMDISQNKSAIKSMPSHTTEPQILKISYDTRTADPLKTGHRLWRLEVNGGRMPVTCVCIYSCTHRQTTTPKQCLQPPIWRLAKAQNTHPFNGPLSGTTQESQYQKGKTNLDFTEARDSEWQWRQLGHMQVCTTIQSDNHASTPPLSFLQAGCTEGKSTKKNKKKKDKQTDRWTDIGPMQCASDR